MQSREGGSRHRPQTESRPIVGRIEHRNRNPRRKESNRFTFLTKSNNLSDETNNQPRKCLERETHWVLWLLERESIIIIHTSTIIIITILRARHVLLVKLMKWNPIPLGNLWIPPVFFLEFPSYTPSDILSSFFCY